MLQLQCDTSMPCIAQSTKAMVLLPRCLGGRVYAPEKGQKETAPEGAVWGSGSASVVPVVVVMPATVVDPDVATWTAVIHLVLRAPTALVGHAGRALVVIDGLFVDYRALV